LLTREGVPLIETDDFPITLRILPVDYRVGSIDLTLSPGSYRFEMSAVGGAVSSHGFQVFSTVGMAHGYLLFSALTAGLVPAPSAVLLLGLAAAPAMKRRRRGNS
ncbi:MAG TPA: hypothetical protein VFF65_11910, partial [Phycisphaerales bacterium]|nr:hypothetical protein [Phycisphaerales bacterium]